MANFPSAYLTKDNFLAFTGLTAGDVNVVLLDRIILSSNKILVKELGDLFSLQNGKTLSFQTVKSNNIFSIGFWQRTGLVVSIVQNGQEKVLDNKDYILRWAEDKGNYNAIYAVILKSYWLGFGDELKITGTFGYSEGLPDELSMLDINLYKMIKQAILEDQNDTDSGGRGEITQAKIGEVSTSYGNSNNSFSSSNTRPKITMDALPGAILAESFKIKSDYKYDLDLIII